MLRNLRRYDSSIFNSSLGRPLPAQVQAEAEAEEPVFTCQCARACMPVEVHPDAARNTRKENINRLPPPSFDVTPPTSLTGNPSLSYAPDTVLLRPGLLVESLYIAMPHPL